MIDRLKDGSGAGDGCYKRYVITNPPFNFTLLATDQVETDLYILKKGNNCKQYCK